MLQNEKSSYGVFLQKGSPISAGGERMEEDKGDFAGKSENMIKVVNSDARSDLIRITRATKGVPLFFLLCPHDPPLYLTTFR
jgi:hypothetical protein